MITIIVNPNATTSWRMHKLRFKYAPDHLRGMVLERDYELPVLSGQGAVEPLPSATCTVRNYSRFQSALALKHLLSKWNFSLPHERSFLPLIESVYIHFSP